MWWRIFYGTMRIILGIWLLNLIDMPLSDLLHSLMSHELVEDPNDLLYRILNSFLQLHPLSVTYFLSASLLRHKLWAFPVSLWLIALFLLYEVFRITQTHSLILLGLICVDSVIWWLIKDEWRKTRRRRGLG